MHTDRIQQLEKFYAEEPDDPFNVYALALEYLKVDTAKAGELFKELLEVHAGYLPTYYHAAKFFDATGNRAKAVEVFEKGIALAAKLQETKAMRELQSAYDEMMFD